MAYYRGLGNFRYFLELRIKHVYSSKCSIVCQLPGSEPLPLFLSQRVHSDRVGFFPASNGWP